MLDSVFVEGVDSTAGGEEGAGGAGPGGGGGGGREAIGHPPARARHDVCYSSKCNGRVETDGDGEPVRRARAAGWRWVATPPFHDRRTANWGGVRDNTSITTRDTAPWYCRAARAMPRRTNACAQDARWFNATDFCQPFPRGHPPGHPLKTPGKKRKSEEVGNVLCGACRPLTLDLRTAGVR